MGPTDTFLRARDLLLAERDDYGAAFAKFRWPELDRFNWALDWFDTYARGNARIALHIADDKGIEVKASFADLSERSNRVANWFRAKVPPSSIARSQEPIVRPSQRTSSGCAGERVRITTW